MKKCIFLLMSLCLPLCGFTASAESTEAISAEPESIEAVSTETEMTQAAGIDYLALVNKLNPLPEGWEESLKTVTITNSVGDDVEVEEKAYAAYELLKADLEENDGIYTELDSARRSIAEQQDIMDRFTEKYGADYAAKTVAQPGYSEHHTGLALDLYFRIKDEDGSFTDVYYNEDMEKEEYRGIWDTIHSKLADYGFILRYLEGEEHITGYRYEPWHIRYVDSADIAGEIMSQPGLTLEEYLAGGDAPEVSIDLTGSELYTEEELYDSMLAVKCRFASWEGCELHAIRYGGDEAVTQENLDWLNSLNEDAGYTQVMELLMDFHTDADIQGAWEPDQEYTDYQWWLARPEDGDWEIVSNGY
ncbi:MAG: M15 family metallopeptidase [Lachnospiraceae bacterium]|nr:M15 family metallopeptidase [Lachnospiraceae bacterium]